MLAVTKKFTTGAPHFIETGHIQPADISDELKEKIRQVADHALDTLMLENGAAHVELKVNENGDIKLIEIGGRMGGDFIGSDLVQLSTGYDFVGNVVKIAMGDGIDEPEIRQVRTVGIRFITVKEDLKEYSEMKKKSPGCIIKDKVDRRIVLKADPTNIYERCGYYIYEVR
jgi:biotin carboxylase